MTDTLPDTPFYLPSEFLTPDDFRTINLPPPPSLFRRSSSALTSPGESVVSSADTDTSSDDPDEFIAELTRHLARSALRDHHHQKSWAPLATSPQSTLTGFLNSRRTIPPEFTDEEALELIYAAAERAAHIRMACQAQIMKHQQQQQRRPMRGFLGASAPNNHQFPNQRWMAQQQMARNKGVFECGSGHPITNSSFPPLTNHHRYPAGDRHGMRAMFLSGGSPPVNKQPAGTGVFIPRRVNTGSNMKSPAEYRKKQGGGCSTVLLPARVVQALNLNIEEMNSHHLPSNNEILVGRRNAVMMMGQQQRRGIRGGEGPMAMTMEVPLLPQEWTY